jgi:predicted transcriptional regulator
MSTTTVRLNDDDEQILDKLAPEFGGRSGAIRRALRYLAADVDRRDALDSFLESWNADAGPVDEQAVAAMAQRYGL